MLQKVTNTTKSYESYESARIRNNTCATGMGVRTVKVL